MIQLSLLLEYLININHNVLITSWKFFGSENEIYCFIKAMATLITLLITQQPTANWFHRQDYWSWLDLLFYSQLWFQKCYTLTILLFTAFRGGRKSEIFRFQSLGFVLISFYKRINKIEFAQALAIKHFAIFKRYNNDNSK